MNVKKHKKSFLVGLTLLFIGVAVLSASFSVISASTPHRFLGYATDTLLNPIKDGIVIRAMVVDVDGSTENHTTTVNNSLSGKNYDFDVLDLEEDNDGRPIYFYVGSENTTQSVSFVIGGKNVGFSDYYNLTIVDVPQITDNSPSNGTTGDSFTFNVTVLDYVDEAGNLTVSANWSHGSLSGNQSLSNVAGNYFEVNITLDHSISNMTYTVWANDTSGNMNSSGPHTVTVIDNDNPNTTLEIGEPLHPNGVTNNSNLTSSTNIFLNATDNIGSYYVHYRVWNTTNGWSTWTDGTADTNLTINLIEEGKNYLEYYSSDDANNNESHYNATLWVDDSAPTTTLTINEQVHPNIGTDGVNITSSTTMTLAVTDNPAHGSGVVAGSTAYRFWNSSSGWTVWTTYVGAFSLGADEGMYYLEYNSSDNLSLG